MSQFEKVGAAHIATPLQRYKLGFYVHDQASLLPADDGDLVLYAAVSSRIAALEAQVRQLLDELDAAPARSAGNVTQFPIIS